MDFIDGKYECAADASSNGKTEPVGSQKRHVYAVNRIRAMGESIPHLTRHCSVCTTRLDHSGRPLRAARPREDFTRTMRYIRRRPANLFPEAPPRDDELGDPHGGIYSRRQIPPVLRKKCWKLCQRG